MKHKCPAKDCSRSVAYEELACLTHWRKLPWRLRVNLNHAWRDADPAGHALALQEALSWYRTNDCGPANVSSDYNVSPPSGEVS